MQLHGAFLITLAVAALSVFLLGLGSLLKRRCSLRPCGVSGDAEGPAASDACSDCPLAKAERTEPA